MSRRPSVHNPLPPPPAPEIYSDSRYHGPQGPSRHVRIPRAASYGGGAIAKSEDGQRCIVAGKDSLRILRISEPGTSTSSEHKFAVGRGGYRIDASRNFWTGSGLKIDSSSTDVIWGHGPYSNKIITSARNGELIMWDLNKAGPTKYERRVKEHLRAIHRIAYSTALQYFCITGSADGYIRVWDLRDMRNSITQIRHPSSVRAVAISPVSWKPLQALSALDNGNIYMWDLTAGQRGQLHRIPAAHSGPVLSLDWTHPASSFTARPKGEPVSASSQSSSSSGWYSNMGFGQFEDLSNFGLGGGNAANEGEFAGMGWLASGGMDRCVKVWNLNALPGESHISRRPVYTLHTSFPVRRVLWRPGYECELAVVSSVDIDTGPKANQTVDSMVVTPSGSPHTESVEAGEQTAGEEDKLTKLSNASGIGDPVEIWDVRRGYVAKWTVRSSAVEGGVTDVDFADSHTMWAQHFSGAFSQLDLRFSSRPLDAIPRTAVTWDATGILTFVAGKQKRWEIPYDDIGPDKRLTTKRKPKALGDKPFVPSSQSVGSMAGHGLLEDVDTFVKLAHGYVIEGAEKTILCSQNADVAFAAGKYGAVQVWQLVGSLLTDIIPTEIPTPTPTRSLSPLPFITPRLPHSTSAPGAIPTVTHPASLPQPMRSLSENVYGPITGRNSPGSRSNGSTPNSRSEEKNRAHSAASQSISSSGTGYLSPLHTPVSSTATSPRRPSSPLPPVSSSMIATTAHRRPSGSGLPATLSIGPPPARTRLSGSSVRRPSFSTQSVVSISENTSDSRGQTHGSLRHVGEGALDDSDSEGSDGEVLQQSQRRLDTLEADSDEEPESTSQPSSRRSSFYRPGVSPYTLSRSSSVQPSPLSQVAGQQTWTEDEKDEEDSPSPASTDSDSSLSDGQPGLGSHSRQFSSSSSRFGNASNKSRRGSTKNGRSKTRSRSSTVASLAVSATSSHGRLLKQESQSSIRTVTATPTTSSAYTLGGLQRDDTVRDINAPSTHGMSGTLAGASAEVGSVRSASYYSQSRPRSEALSNDVDADPGCKNVSRASRAALAVQQEYVKEAEARLREAGWEAMRETLEVFADEGDVQMCAMLSLIAPDELRISNKRVLRFLESYIELLMRLRLHATAAYVRKFTSIDDVRNTTGMETTIYTSCGRCHKSLLHPVAKHTHTGKPSGDYAYCTNCKGSSTRCSICHLPVRALLFQCSVCLHGGHHACYQQYYLRRPLMELPMSVSSINAPDTRRSTPTTPDYKYRGRAMSRSVDGEGSDDGLSSRDGDDGRYRGHDFPSTEAKSTMLGHPCAAGCGHYCWAANEALLYNGSDTEVRFA